MSYIIIKDKRTGKCTWSIKPTLLTNYCGPNTMKVLVYESTDEKAIEFHCNTCNDNRAYARILKLITDTRMNKNIELLFELHDIVFDWHSKKDGNEYIAFFSDELKESGIF